MAEVTHAPSGPTTNIPAFLPVPFHFLAGAVLMVWLGGPEQLSMSVRDAGGVVYLALLASLAVAGVNTALLARAGRGSDIPAFVPVLLALLPWLLGLGGTLLGLVQVARAVEQVNPADKATILAAGFSEAINNRLIGCWFAAAQLAAVAIGLGLVAATRAGPKKNGAAAGVGGAAVLALLVSGAAMTTLGVSSVFAMILPAAVLGVALLLVGLGATGEERNLGLSAAAVFAAAAGFAAVTVTVVTRASSQTLAAVANVNPADKFTILAVGAEELLQGQLFLRIGALIAFGAAAAATYLAYSRAAQSNPNPVALIIPAVLAVGIVLVDLGVTAAGPRIAAGDARPERAVDLKGKELVTLESHSGSDDVVGVLSASGEVDFGGGSKIRAEDAQALAKAFDTGGGREMSSPAVAVERGARAEALVSLVHGAHLAGATGIMIVGRPPNSTPNDKRREAVLTMFPFAAQLANGLSSVPLYTRGYLSEYAKITYRARVSDAPNVTVESTGTAGSFSIPTTPLQMGELGYPAGDFPRGDYGDVVALEVAPDATTEQVLTTAANLWASNYHVLLTPPEQ